MSDVNKRERTLARLFCFHWQWIFLFSILCIFSVFAAWSLFSMVRSDEEQFCQEALTNCKVLEVVIADTVVQHSGQQRIQQRIDTLMKKDRRIVRLSFIALAADGTYRHVASSLKGQIYKPAHNEDLEAIAADKVIILNEKYQNVGALDITYPVHDPNGKVLGVVGYTVSRDNATQKSIVLIASIFLVILSLAFYFVYLLRRSFKEIKTHKEAAQVLFDSGQMKNQFISTAAHELRTPLSSITGYVEVLLHPELIGGIDKETQQDFLEEVYDKSEALCSIIDDLLDVSRIESGLPLSLDLKPCDVATVLSKEVGHFRIQFPTYHFELALAENQGTEIWLDRNKLVQIVENLLANAVKFSAPERVIRVSGEGTGTGYRLIIADDGIGMTPRQVEHIFDKFYRADHKNTAISGLGLGMSIVQQIVVAHAGKIDVASKPGAGTVVTVDIPAGPLEANVCLLGEPLVST